MCGIAPRLPTPPGSALAVDEFSWKPDRYTSLLKGGGSFKQAGRLLVLRPTSSAFLSLVMASTSARSKHSEAQWSGTAPLLCRPGGGLRLLHLQFARDRTGPALWAPRGALAGSVQGAGQVHECRRVVMVETARSVWVESYSATQSQASILLPNHRCFCDTGGRSARRAVLLARLGAERESKWGAGRASEAEDVTTVWGGERGSQRVPLARDDDVDDDHGLPKASTPRERDRDNT